MKTIYYHCFAGISGDMNLSAMIDLGVPCNHLLQELEKLSITGYKIEINTKQKKGISGTQVKVLLEKHDHDHHHHHGHGHSHTEHHHRTFKSIKEIINNSTLSKEVKDTSIAIFEKVAIAEGKVHGKPADDVHFHEVGAVDSIVDIVGAAICYHYINPDKVICSTVELGGGFVNCAHGKYPVPAPATTEIVATMPVRIGTVNFETTTPTGAAILATLVDEFTDQFSFTIEKTGYGIGHRDLEIPNVLRVHIGNDTEDADLDHSTAKILECNLDDMPAEHFEFLLDKLIGAGAQDVYLTPIIMKKSRPATMLSILCSTDKESELSQIVFTNSTTLGIRNFVVNKSMLKRTMVTIDTKYGSIDVKQATLNNNIIKQKPEYEQCKQAAEKHKVSLIEINNEVMKTLNKS